MFGNFFNLGVQEDMHAIRCKWYETRKHDYTGYARNKHILLRFSVKIQKVADGGSLFL